MRFTDANWNSKLDEQIFLFESFYSVSGRPACFDYKSMDSNLLRILHPKWICFHLRFYWDWWNRNERIICGSLQVDAVVSLLLQISGRSLPEPWSGDWKSVNNSESFRERNVQRICKRRNVNLELRFCRAIEPAPSTVIRISFYTPTVSSISTWPDSWNRSLWNRISRKACTVSSEELINFDGFNSRKVRTKTFCSLNVTGIFN